MTVWRQAGLLFIHKGPPRIEFNYGSLTLVHTQLRKQSKAGKDARGHELCGP